MAEQEETTQVPKAPRRRRRRRTRPGKFTIAEVAEKAGISKATVSRVLNNYEFVSAETRAKVRAAIAELNYRPSEVARAMTSGYTKALGVILPDYGDDRTGRSIHLITESARRRGYDALVRCCGASEDDEVRAIRAMAARAVDGILMVPSLQKETESEFLNVLNEMEIPFVLMRPLEGTDADQVQVDYAAVLEESLGQMADRSRSRVAVIAPTEAQRIEVSDLQAGSMKRRFENALKVAGLNAGQCSLYTPDQTRSEIRALIARLFSTEIKPDGVITWDRVALNTVSQILWRAGLVVGKDVDIIASEDDALQSPMREALDVVISSAEREASRLAVRRLCARIEGTAEQTTSILTVRPRLTDMREVERAEQERLTLDTVVFT